MGKIVFITSSWRKESNSSWLAAHAGEAAVAKGHEVVTIDIAKKAIGPCRACGACHKENNGRCIQKDDMGQYYPLLEEADTLIFVSPVYWFNLCGQLKQFIDRCYALTGKKLADGTTCLHKKRMGLILAHEGDDPFDSGGINAIRSIQDTCSYLEIPFVGALYGCALHEGEMATNSAMIEKAKAYGASL